MVENFEYWPQTKGGTNRKRFRFGNYVAIVRSDFDPIEDEDDEIEYLFVMAVFKLPELQLCLAVASEMSAEVRGLYERHPELAPEYERVFALHREIESDLLTKNPSPSINSKDLRGSTRGPCYFGNQKRRARWSYCAY